MPMKGTNRTWSWKKESGDSNQSEGEFGRVAYILRTLGPGGVLRLLGSRLFSVNHYYLLGKNLAAPLECPEAIGIMTPLMEITKEDIAMINDSLNSLDANDKREVLARLMFYWNGFRNCYIVKTGGNVAYMQWIIFPTENQTIKEKYSARFYPLTRNQVMIENAFTFPRYRGTGYLLHGTAALLDLARSKGYRSAICYIRRDRVASLNEFTRMGFRIIRMLSEYRVFGRVWRKL
jgi:hypothetical protein